MRFIADGMLGKLTRWLRMLGHDVKYYNATDDKDLIKAAKAEGRILLTRDNILYRRALRENVEAFLVRGESEHERLAELAGEYNLKLEIDMASSRCPKCNSKIIPVRKEAIIDLIPETTSRFYNDFWRCSGCGKVYWRGSHWRRIEETLNLARNLTSKVRVEENP